MKVSDSQRELPEAFHLLINGRHYSASTTVIFSRKPIMSASTILVVEDDNIVRMLIVDVLEELEYKVLEAEDGDKALTFLGNEDQKIHLMMTDQGLPGMTGTELAVEARKLRPALPVLFASGYSEIIEVPAGMHSIGKPFSIDQLRDKVKNILEQA
jgi:DNA-binding response OmpR family regulator